MSYQFLRVSPLFAVLIIAFGFSASAVGQPVDAAEDGRVDNRQTTETPSYRKTGKEGVAQEESGDESGEDPSNSSTASEGGPIATVTRMALMLVGNTATVPVTMLPGVVLGYFADSGAAALMLGGATTIPGQIGISHLLGKNLGGAESRHLIGAGIGSAISYGAFAIVLDHQFRNSNGEGSVLGPLLIAGAGPALGFELANLVAEPSSRDSESETDTISVAPTGGIDPDSGETHFGISVQF